MCVRDGTCIPVHASAVLLEKAPVCAWSRKSNWRGIRRSFHSLRLFAILGQSGGLGSASCCVHGHVVKFLSSVLLVEFKKQESASGTQKKEGNFTFNSVGMTLSALAYAGLREF